MEIEGMAKRAKVKGQRLKVKGKRLKVKGSRPKVQGQRLKAKGSRLKAKGSGLKVQARHVGSPSSTRPTSHFCPLSFFQSAICNPQSAIA
jgi:hypothetical protein